MPDQTVAAAESSLGAIAESRDMRYPRVFSFDEMAGMPRIPFSKGCETGQFLSVERDDARYMLLGMCFHDADMEPYEFELAAGEEAHYCVKGRLKFSCRDYDGNEAEFFVEEGEVAYLPGGYWYTLEASGVDSINYWSVAPAMKTGIAPLEKVHMPGARDYAKVLKSLRKPGEVGQGGAGNGDGNG